jgi:hypothetical protein
LEEFHFGRERESMSIEMQGELNRQDAKKNGKPENLFSGLVSFGVLAVQVS